MVSYLCTCLNEIPKLNFWLNWPEYEDLWYCKRFMKEAGVWAAQPFVEYCIPAQPGIIQEILILKLRFILHSYAHIFHYVLFIYSQAWKYCVSTVQKDLLRWTRAVYVAGFLVFQSWKRASVKRLNFSSGNISVRINEFMSLLSTTRCRRGDCLLKTN